MKVAVIGAGMMGRLHCRIFSEMPGVELVGVSDVDVAKAEAVARQYRTRSFSDYKRMIDEVSPQAVTIAIPTVDHRSVSLDIIGLGLHLLIEKPIAMDVQEGLEICCAARDANVKLMVGHVERFNPAIATLKDLLNKGMLGKVYQFDARRQGPSPSRVVDVNVIIDLAVHDIDIIRYLSGSEVVRVYAETAKCTQDRREDLLKGSLRLANGTVGGLTINWLTPIKIRELHVIGERGMIRVDYLTQDLYYYENALSQSDEWEPLSILRGVSEGRMIRYFVAKKEPLRVELESFVASTNGHAEVGVRGEDGVAAIMLAHSLLASGNRNQPISCSVI